MDYYGFCECLFIYLLDYLIEFEVTGRLIGLASVGLTTQKASNDLAENPEPAAQRRYAFPQVFTKTCVTLTSE